MADRPRKTGLAYWGGLALTLLGSLLFGLLLVALSLALAGTGAPRGAVVPDITGQSAAQAEEVLRQAELGLQVRGKVYNQQVPEGAVVSFRPYAGMKVKTGRVVEVIVSRGPREIKVPLLVGTARAAAESKLTTGHLAVGTVAQRASTAPVDQVLEQEPPASKVVARGEAVDLVVSGGPDFGTWKDATGELFIFRRVRLVVPGPEPVQEVHIVTRYRGEETGIYDRVHQPGDEVVVEVYGERGSKVRVYVRDKLVFEKEL